RLEADGRNCAFLPGLLHLSGRPQVPDAQDREALLSAWPASHEEFAKNPCWTKKNLVKRLPSTYVCANGPHCGYFQAPERGGYLPRFYNHYKSEQEISVSTVLCSWGHLEAYGVPKDSSEWQRHQALRASTGLSYASDFQASCRSGNVPGAWLDFWRGLERSPFPALVEYWKFAFR